MQKILVLNGPNLNMLGKREPDIYGTESLADVEAMCVREGKELGFDVSCYQSNHEGDLIDQIQLSRGTNVGIVFNPGAYTHTSVALHDAILSAEVPTIEIHLSNVHAREPFRNHSYISPVALGVICGFGSHGYKLALLALQAELN